VKLVRPGFKELEPVSYDVIDSTKIIATFDLRNAPHGLYDVKVINPGGEQAVLPYRYLIESAQGAEVTIGLGGPRILSPGDTGTYGLTIQNLSNVDVPYVFFQYGIPHLDPEVNGLNMEKAVMHTSLGGSGLTVLGEPEDAPNAALLFTKPLGDDAVECFEPEMAQEIAARSPLGAPAIYGLLFRVADTAKAETVFRQFGLLRPLTDREVPPTLRRALPTDRKADPALVVTGEDARAATSVAPPGLG